MSLSVDRQTNFLIDAISYDTMISGYAADIAALAFLASNLTLEIAATHISDEKVASYVIETANKLRDQYKKVYEKISEKDDEFNRTFDKYTEAK